MLKVKEHKLFLKKYMTNNKLLLCAMMQRRIHVKQARSRIQDSGLEVRENTSRGQMSKPFERKEESRVWSASPSNATYWLSGCA